MWRKIAAAIVLILIVGVAPGIGAPATGTPTEARIVECVSGPGVDRAVIDDLRSKGWGYGEIAMALYLARESGKSLQEIVRMRSSGMGWGQVVRELGLQPGTLGKAQKALRFCEQKMAGSERDRVKQKPGTRKWKKGG